MIPQDAIPEFFFKLFLTNEVVTFMISETNRDTEKVSNETIIIRRSRYRDWKPTDSIEMKKIFGLNLQMHIANLPRTSDYCSTDHLFKTCLVKYNEWKSIKTRFWHFKIEEESERLNKVACLMNNLNKNMKEIYCPDQILSLDKPMVYWRCYLTFRQ